MEGNLFTKGLIEVILYVIDMDAQVRFYRDIFGLDVHYPAGLSDYRQEFWVTLDTGQCLLALHAGGLGRLGADTPKIVFGVEDIHAARRHLVEHGVALLARCARLRQGCGCATEETQKTIRFQLRCTKSRTENAFIPCIG